MLSSVKLVFHKDSSFRLLIEPISLGMKVIGLLPGMVMNGHNEQSNRKEHREKIRLDSVDPVTKRPKNIESHGTNDALTQI